MSEYSECPICGNKASGGLLGGVYIKLHKCNTCGAVFCNECKNDDCCPREECQSDDVRWNYDEAYIDE